MTRTPVSSSNVASVGHDPETNTLQVEYRNGRVYDYAGVSAEEHDQLISAESIGRHLHERIRPGRECTAVGAPQ
jgi:hypothetical protein